MRLTRSSLLCCLALVVWLCQVVPSVSAYDIVDVQHCGSLEGLVTLSGAVLLSAAPPAGMFLPVATWVVALLLLAKTWDVCVLMSTRLYTDERFRDVRARGDVPLWRRRARSKASE